MVVGAKEPSDRVGEVRTEEVCLSFERKPERRNYQSSQGSVWCRRTDYLSRVSGAHQVMRVAE